MLEIKDLTKYYGEVLGVKNLSLTLNEGEVFGFIGPNGSGKSTTIRTIMNLINKTSGEVLLNGEPFTKDRIDLKELVGYLPSEINLYDDLIVKEMLDYHETFYNKDIHLRRKELVSRFKLDEKKKISSLSLGNLKKLGIILAFMHKPKLVILDEPLSGLDPTMQQVFYELIKEEKKRGVTIFYSTHVLSEIDKMCDRVGIIKDGSLIKVETIKKSETTNALIITIESEALEKIIKSLDAEIIEKDDNLAKIKVNMEINKLLKELAKCDIKKLLINEATAEDVFLNYY